MIVDCHVNVYDDRQMLKLFVEQSAIARPGGFAPRADAETVFQAMQDVDKAIIFSLRYKDSCCAAAPRASTRRRQHSPPISTSMACRTC
jgi:hypothetical protein